MGAVCNTKNIWCRPQRAGGRVSSPTHRTARGRGSQVLSYLNSAGIIQRDSRNRCLRSEAPIQIGSLGGVHRLQFPCRGERRQAQYRRMAANENDLYMPTQCAGDVLHVFPQPPAGFKQITRSIARPARMEITSVGPLVDILALPPVNSMNAAVMGVDAPAICCIAPTRTIAASHTPPAAGYELGTGQSFLPWKEGSLCDRSVVHARCGFTSEKRIRA